jgi:hypothetical protein
LLESKTPATTLSGQSPQTIKRTESARTNETNKKSVKSDDQKSKKPDEQKGKTTKSDEQKPSKKPDTVDKSNQIID